MRNNYLTGAGTISSAIALAVLTSGCAQASKPLPPSTASHFTPAENRLPVSVTRPNIVYIVLDDMGYSDLGCYGSSIKTPNIDKLAQQGILYSNYYTQPMSSASRSAVLTGCDSNLVGMGIIADNDLGPDVPNIRGRVYPEYGTIAETLKANAYSTIAVGKWHLGSIPEFVPDGDKEQWPSGKGFDRNFCFIGSQTNQFEPGSLIEGDRFVETDFSDKDYHFTIEMVDRSLTYIDSAKKESPENPFFLYFATGALHGPLQAPKSYIEQYKGVFDSGWDIEREKRLEKQVSLGLLPPDTRLPERNEGVPDWAELNSVSKQVASRHMEVYAAMLTHTDDEIGRLCAELEKRGELDNTVFVLVSDNGANSSGSSDGSPMSHLNENYLLVSAEEQLPYIDEFGGAFWGTQYNSGWAMASSSPFRYNKTCAYNGGVRVPLIVSGANIVQPGRVSHALVDSTDITPTMLDLLNIPQLTELDGLKLEPMTGMSFLASLQSGDPMTHDKTVCMILGNSYMYNNGEYVIARRADQKAQMFSVKDDPTQITDIRAQNKKLFKQLFSEYEEVKRSVRAENFSTDGAQGTSPSTLIARYGFTPLDVVFSKMLGTNGITQSGKYMLSLVRASEYDFGAGYKNGGVTVYEDPRSPGAARDYTYDPTKGMFYSEAFAQTQFVSHTISTVITTPANPEGVVFARGGSEGGYVFYIMDGKLVFEHNFCGSSVMLVSKNRVPANSTIPIEFEYKKETVWEGQGILRMNGTQEATATIQNHPTFVSFDYVSFGEDAGSLVSRSYTRDFTFNGTVAEVRVHLGDDMWKWKGDKNGKIPPVLDLAAVAAAHGTSDIAKLTDKEILERLEKAYIYTYPLMIMSKTAASGTNVPKPLPTGYAPINQIGHMRFFPDADFKIIPRANVDTLYSSCLFDLSAGPLVFSIPDTGTRFNLLQFMDGWTNVFASPGTRTTGNRAQQFVVAKKGWQGAVPAGMSVYECPTSLGWMVGRLQINDKAELGDVLKLLDGYQVVPLSKWGNSYQPPVNTVHASIPKEPASTQIVPMSLETYFNEANALLVQNPPYAYDAKILAEIAPVGVGPGKTFSTAAYSEELKKQIAGIPAKAREQIAARSTQNQVASNGWSYALGSAKFGTDYVRRAQVAFRGLGANLNEDAVYPAVQVDQNGETLSGEHKYVLHYSAQEIPKAGAFWSLTLYNEHDNFAANPINRYALRDRDPLVYGADGSLTLYIQKEAPETSLMNNWLPAPDGPFTLVLRLYMPPQNVIEGIWTSPPVKKMP